MITGGVLTLETIEKGHARSIAQSGKAMTIPLAQSTIDFMVFWTERDARWRKLGPELYKQRYLKLKLSNRCKYKRMNLPE